MATHNGISCSFWRDSIVCCHFGKTMNMSFGPVAWWTYIRPVSETPFPWPCPATGPTKSRCEHELKIEVGPALSSALSYDLGPSDLTLKLSKVDGPTT